MISIPVLRYTLVVTVRLVRIGVPDLICDGVPGTFSHHSFV